MTRHSTARCGAATFARTVLRWPGKRVLPVMVAVLLALLAGPAFALSDACNAFNSEWAAARTFSPVGDGGTRGAFPAVGDEYNGYTGFTDSEELVFSVSSSNSNANEQGFSDDPMGTPGPPVWGMSFGADKIEYYADQENESWPGVVKATEAGQTYYPYLYSGSESGVLHVQLSCREVTPPPPIAGAVSVSVAYGSSANPIMLNLSGGATSSVAVSAAAAHGTATASGTSITYTPTAGYAGPDSFTYTATNGSGTSAPATIMITVSPPTLSISPATLANATVGSAYSQALSASGGIGPYVFAITSGSVPPGLTWSGNVLSGTPTTYGDYSFSVTATEAGAGFSTTSNYTMHVAAIAPQAPAIGTATAGDGQASVSFTAPAFTGGAPITSYVATANPGGASGSSSSSPITVTGLVNGTAYTFTVTASNTAGPGSSSAASNSVTPMGTQTISFSNPGAQNFGTSPQLNATASSTLPVSFTSSTTSVCTVTSGGALTTVSPGTCTIAADQAGNGAVLPAPTVTQSFAIVVPGGAVTLTTPSPLPVGTGGVPYSLTFSAAGGAAPYNFGIDSGAIPAGMTLSSAGALEGTPTASGTFNIVVGVTDSASQTAQKMYQLTINAPGVVLAPASLSDGQVGTPFMAAISASGGSIPYTYSVTAGELPAGLALSAAGALSGTPTTAGPANFTIQATDKFNFSGTQAYSLNIIDSAPVAAATAAAVAYDTATPIDLSAAISGVHTSIAIATAPAHGTTSIAGDVVTYTPAAGYFGADSFTYTATGPGGTSAPATVTLAVAPGAVFEPASGQLPDAMAGEHYSQLFAVDGGTDYQVASGLPDGLAMSSDGTLEGTLGTGSAGNYSFTVTATLGGGTASAGYTLTVRPNAVTAEDKIVPILPGATPLPVDLTAGATGGPFTAAILGTVSPPQAGTAEIIMGDVASIDTVWSDKFYLKFHPNPAYSGQVLVGYTLIGAGGASSSATVTFIASLDANGVANNFDHLIKDFVQARASLLATGVETPGLRQRRSMESGARPGVINVRPSSNSVTMNFASSLAELRSWSEAGNAADTLAQGDPSQALPFNFWIDGTATLHLRDDEAGDEHWGRFALVSVGGDYLVNDKLLVGLALHGDFMDDNADTTRIEGTGILIGPYVSAEIVDGVFLDASLYYGHSWNEVTTSIFGGSFETERLLAKASLEGEWALSEALTLRPKANVFYLHEVTGQYTVTDGLGSAITIAGFSTDQFRLSGGGTLEYTVDLGEGLNLTPYIGAQLGLSLTRHEASTVFTTLSTGFDLTGLGNLTLGGTVEADLESDSFKSVSAKARLSAGF